MSLTSPGGVQGKGIEYLLDKALGTIGLVQLIDGEAAYNLVRFDPLLLESGPESHISDSLPCHSFSHASQGRTCLC